MTRFWNISIRKKILVSMLAFTLIPILLVSIVAITITYAKQFEEKMLAEENIKVTVNLEMPSSDQYESILQARLSGDDAPDLYTLHCNNLGTYNDSGYLYDLSGEALADVIYENVKETVTIDGKLLAVPIESQAWGVLYNKAIQ